MTRADFDTYRRAFAAFRACVAGDSAPAACASQWTQGAGTLLASDTDRKQATEFAAYFVEFLRKNGGASADCRNDRADVVEILEHRAEHGDWEQTGRVGGQGIFEPFFSTKERRGGTGLGMSIVEDIARAHGAAIEIESTEGRGTTVRLHWPAAGEAVAAARDDDAATPTVASNRTGTP